MRKGWLSKLAVGMTLLTFVFTTSGCFGGFNLTRKVHRFNRDVSPDKWVQELVFLGLVIVPVYSFATLIDALIVNSIQFWTGRNPVTVGKEPAVKVVDRGDTTLVQTMAATPEAKTMTVDEYHRGTLVKTVVMRHEVGQPSITTEVRYPDGRVETHVTTLETDGSALVGSVDTEGRATTRLVSAAEVQRLSDRAQALAAAARATQVASAATASW
jgi:hypothetical protein